MKIQPGLPYPLGSTFDGRGTNFSLFSEVAQRVELCLFDAEGRQTCIDMPEVTAYCWHVYLPGIMAGQRYGFRVHGPWDPARGLRCAPSKLLLDPYAKAIEGGVTWDDSLFTLDIQDKHTPAHDADSAPFMPKSVVINPFFDWRNDRSPKFSLHETIIYELHVKGFTQLHPEIPPELRGKYAALAHPVCLDYFKELGITALELMPVHQFIHDKHLVDKGLRNYWGYNSIGFFAPHNEYSSSGQDGQQVQEFKQMVSDLHEAGLEVILDVVYNHTAEGNHLGPTLCFRGIDNQAYYRLDPGDPEQYMDFTGTGNSLNMLHPHVLQLIMDSLRYWILEMHVDGFRFDLAAALARELHDVDRLSSFFDIIHQDPVISQVKLIAEPWDVGDGGYQVGRFPPQWSEWNGMYRDSVRDYWRGQEETLGELANRFTGSSDLYESTGRRPNASVNFVTAHDGMTLHDLVTYSTKHNEANGENNCDGRDDCHSFNCGIEGETDDPEVNAQRSKQVRNFLATLFLSQGIPMLLGGDEMGRTQRGNNNAYCQDNEISWFDWEHRDETLYGFVRNLISLRREHPVFRRWKWFQGRPIWGAGVKDIGWFRADGSEMTEQDWQDGVTRSLQVFLAGQLNMMDRRGDPVVDDNFLVLFSAESDVREFTVPLRDAGKSWRKILDTTHLEAGPTEETYLQEEKVRVEPLSVVVLCHVQP